MTLKTISYSYLHLLSCPFAAFLRYSAGIKSPTTPWLALGNAVHYALEMGHKEFPFVVEGAISFFLKEFQRIIDDDEVFIGWPQLKKLQAEGIEMIGRYHEQLNTGTIPADPMEIEKEFRIPFSGIEIIGRIDKLDKSETGGIIVTDFKTGKAKPDEWFLRHDLQLTAYAWACLTLYKTLPEKLVWHHLRTGDLLETTRTMQDIRELEKMLENAIWMDQKGVRHRVFHDKICGQCDYSGFARAGGPRPSKSICDDHILEDRVVRELGLDAH